MKLAASITTEKNRAVRSADISLVALGKKTIGGTYSVYIDDTLTDLPFTYFEPTLLEDLAIAVEIAQKYALIAQLAKKYDRAKNSSVIVIELL